MAHNTPDQAYFMPPLRQGLERLRVGTRLLVYELGNGRFRFRRLPRRRRAARINYGRLPPKMAGGPGDGHPSLGAPGIALGSPAKLPDTLQKAPECAFRRVAHGSIRI